MFKREKALTILKKQGRKKGWLATELEVSSDTIKRYLDGDTEPTKATVAFIAGLLSVDVSEIWQESTTKKAS